MVEVVNKNTKCAEIHCNLSVDSKFLIKCICGISLLNYDAFLRHFSSDHLKTEVLQLKATSNDGLDEPLLELELSMTSSPMSLESEYDAFSQAHNNTDVLESEFLPSQAERRAYKPRHKTNICPYCGRTFRRRYLLETHLNIHTGIKPHQCEMCGKQFRAVSTLTRHLRTHEQRKELKCQHCEKLFTHRSALLSHELRHTQVRHWACSRCDKRFYTRNQMDTHARKMHVTVSEQRFGVTDQNEYNLSQLPFACEICGKRYRSASTLSTHKLKKHYRSAEYICERCNKKFVNANQLQQHQLIHVKPEDPIK